MASSINFIPLDYDYFDWQGRNYVRVVGRDEEGRRVCIVDNFDPYLWAILKPGVSEAKVKRIQEKLERLKVELPSRTTRVERTEVLEKKFLGKRIKAIKIFITNYKDAHPIANQIGFKEIEARRGYDIPLITKYIIEKKLSPFLWYKISGTLVEPGEFGDISSGFDADICFRAEKITRDESKAGGKEFSPKILAYDIEVDDLEIGRGEILMISLVSRNFKKVLTWKKSSSKQEYVELCRDEAEMIEKFIEYVKKLSPDFLVGYFSDGFDMPYLKARAEKNKIRLALGLDGSQPSFARGRIPSAKVSGIVHVDLFRFIETVYAQYLQSETLGLDEVASELLGEGKQDFDHKHSTKLKDKEWKEYFKYNLQDSILTYKLAEKFWPDMQEFCKIIQEPLFNITRNGMSQLLENYILHHLENYNEIAEKRPLEDDIRERRARRMVEGAFVLQPRAGLYEKLAIFDFTSMHTSIIVSFNISKATLLEKQQKGCYEAPEVDWEGRRTRFYFSREPGFLPDMCKKLIKKRKECKKQYQENPNPFTKSRSNAFKLLSAAVHGYIGFFGARYYSLESSASILAFVRKFNKETINKVERAGYKVIYSDTDSVAFELQDRGKKQVLEFLKKLNSELPGIMELELEDFYKRGIWVTKRTGEFGAKKKYALINYENKLKIRGFETVRRDWCNLARELQNKVLLKILREGNEKSALEYVREVIKKLKKREVDREKIMIRTQLKKPLSEYKSITPHVIAARKMEQQGMPVDAGMIIKYFIAETRSSKKLVREKVKLPDDEGKYNMEYYLEHQIVPAVENIFEVFGVTRNELLGKGQKKLGEF